MDRPASTVLGQGARLVGTICPRQRVPRWPTNRVTIALFAGGRADRQVTESTVGIATGSQARQHQGELQCCEDGVPRKIARQ